MPAGPVMVHESMRRQPLSVAGSVLRALQVTIVIQRSSVVAGEVKQVGQVGRG